MELLERMIDKKKSLKWKSRVHEIILNAKMRTFDMKSGDNIISSPRHCQHLAGYHIQNKDNRFHYLYRTICIFII